MVTLGGDVTVVVMLFSKVLPQSAVLRHCVRKLWIYCLSGQACERRRTLMANLGTQKQEKFGTAAQRKDVSGCSHMPFRAIGWDGL